MKKYAGSQKFVVGRIFFSVETIVYFEFVYLIIIIYFHSSLSKKKLSNIEILKYSGIILECYVFPMKG